MTAVARNAAGKPLGAWSAVTESPGMGDGGFCTPIGLEAENARSCEKRTAEEPAFLSIANLSMACLGYAATGREARSRCWNQNTRRIRMCQGANQIIWVLNTQQMRRLTAGCHNAGNTPLKISEIAQAMRWAVMWSAGSVRSARPPEFVSCYKPYRAGIMLQNSA